jgi:photosystem II stability/assembly factor-like uncharacterized protein
MRASILLGLLLPLPLAAQRLEERPSGTTALLQAVSVVDSAVAWVSGHRGTVLRTVDGGVTWQARPVPGADSLEFRDVHGASALVAWVLSAGPGERSRIFRTTDGGVSWTEQFRNRDADAFYDCFAFFDDRRAVAYSDASGGRTNLLVTHDAGATWHLPPATSLPAPLEGEGAFAASGGCVVTHGTQHAWAALGGPGARLLRTTDGGSTWQVLQTPLVQGAAAGNTAASFNSAERGIVVGGRIDAYTTDTSAAVVATTRDGGGTWTLGTRPPRPGALFGVTWATTLGPDAAIAAGPGGLFVTRDGAATWEVLDTRAFWSVGAGGRVAYAVGPRGTIVSLTW